MIINIIPAIRLPRSTGKYSYSVPTELQKSIKIGQIIEVNFRNKNISGIVIGKELKKPKYKLKEINRILYPEVLITDSQIKLIKYIASNCGASLGVVTKSLVPDIPKRQKNTKTLKQKNTKTKKHQNKKILFWYSTENELFKNLKEKIKSKKPTQNASHNESGKQILILVPEIEMIDKVIDKLELKEKDYIKNDSKIAMGRYFKNWLDILSGKNKIIIGTKISVLLPFSNLSEIIIYNSHDWNHKQSDINPRYDARDITEWLAKKHGCELILTTPAPSIEQFYKHQKFNTKSLPAVVQLDCRTVGVEGAKAGRRIIDLKKEREKGNYTFLSDDLIHNIKASLEENKKTFIFHNRKGLANFITCHDCGYVFKCPECNISLAYHSNDKKLHCHHCKFKQDIFPMCPKCQRPNIKFRGQGVDRIRSELEKEFGDTKMLILEKSSLDSLKALKNFDIIIGTEYAINKIDFGEFNLIGFTNFDQILNHPDFRAQEKAYQLFYEIKSQAPDADYIIQTQDIENIVLQSIIQNNPEIFYKQELSNRKELNYPPFAKIIKLIYKDKKEKSAIYNSKRLVLDLKGKLKNIEILGPFENYPKKEFGKYKYNIIIKIPLDFDLQKIIKLVPNNFVIDVDPEKLN